MSPLPCGCYEGQECSECASMTAWVQYQEATEAWEADCIDPIEYASRWA